jgi:acyl carrier protein
MTPEEALATFGLALSGPVAAQVVVSTTDLADRLRRPPRDLVRPPVLASDGLPAPDARPSDTPSRVSGAESLREPRSELERLIAAIWKELLGVQQVVARDNFFDLGGHSLLAIKVIHRLERLTGVRIEPADLMFHTLGQLAASVEARVPPRTPRKAGGTARILSGMRSLVQGLIPRGEARE